MSELPLLEVVGLCKSYGTPGRWWRRQTLRALCDVSFRIAPKEALAVVGESGCGKSTLARLLVRLEQADAGKIYFQGRDLLAEEPRSGSRAYRSQVQMVSQDPFASLNPVHTVQHHLARPLLRHKQAHKAEISTRVAELLAAVGLEPAAEIAGKHPDELSGGQRQRVAIARALAVGPKLVVADEPTAMLDVSLRLDVLNLLMRLRDERGLSYLFITHDLASARYLADRVLVIYAGQVVETGEVEAVLREPAHPYTQALLKAASHDGPGLPVRRAEARERPVGLTGCPFVDRCPSATTACHQAMPQPARLSNDHWARCHALPRSAVSVATLARVSTGGGYG